MITFKEQAEIYIAGLKTRKNRPTKPTTRATFESTIRHHAIPFLGEKTLAEIDNEDLRLFVSHLVGDEELKPRSVRLVLTVTKQIIASAVDTRGNQLYPKQWNGSYIDAPSTNEDEKPESVTREQIETALCAACPIVQTFIATLCATGLRRGEALALRVDDFDADAGLLHVRGTRGQFGRTTPKTKSSRRVVNLTPEITDMLRNLPAHGEYLFPLEIKTLRRELEHLGIKAHACRRFRTSWLRYQKCHEDVIRFWMGHRSGSQTDEYVRLAAVWDLQTLVQEVGIGFALVGHLEIAKTLSELKLEAA